MKKILILILVVILLCSLAINTAVSYFVDTDYDVNTMTVGNVMIEQYEMYRTSENQLVSWHANGTAPAPMLLPVVGDLTPVLTEIPGIGKYHLVSASNVLDKIVYVKNTGNEDAYLRTLFAFEMIPTKEGDVIKEWTDPIAAGLVIPVVNTLDGTLVSTGCTFEDDGVRYVVYAFVYSRLLRALPVAAGEATAATNSSIGSEESAVSEETVATTAVPPNVSVPSLLQVYLASTVGNEFYEAVGSEYSILILSQAVQSTQFTNAADAFEAAFPYGDEGENVAGWFGVTSEGGKGA